MSFFNGDIKSSELTLSSSTTSQPILTIENTTNDANGAIIKFIKDKGAAGVDNDVAGLIQFYADDAAQEQVLFSEIKSQVKVATNGQEGGKFTISVAENDGTSTAGLVIEDGDADGEIDVTIGAGTSSVTTVAGSIVSSNVSNATSSVPYPLVSRHFEVITSDSNITLTANAMENLFIFNVSNFSSLIKIPQITSSNVGRSIYLKFIESTSGTGYGHGDTAFSATNSNASTGPAYQCNATDTFLGKIQSDIVKGSNANTHVMIVPSSNAGAGSYSYNYDTSINTEGADIRKINFDKSYNKYTGGERGTSIKLTLSVVNSGLNDGKIFFEHFSLFRHTNGPDLSDSTVLPGPFVNNGWS